jgi:hypothetical protein
MAWTHSGSGNETTFWNGRNKMSMNIYIYAARVVSFKDKKGKKQTETQVTVFDALQTPTEVTYEIVKSNDPAQVYIDWVLRRCSVDEQWPTYTDDDFMQEREPIGVEIVNQGKEHVEKFKQWMIWMEEKGYEIKYEVM